MGTKKENLRGLRPELETYTNGVADYYPGVFRFRVGDKVWVRDKAYHRGGYRIVEAVVEALHAHPDRHPWYPNGEGYQLCGWLWWSCYPGCRVFTTREDALKARMTGL